MGAELRLTLAEYAASNQDGTFTIVRGGIEHWEAALPLNLALIALAELPPDTLAVGNFDVSCTLTGPSDLKLLEVGGVFEVLRPERWSRVTLPIFASVQAYGMCWVDVKLGNFSARASIDVRPIKA